MARRPRLTAMERLLLEQTRLGLSTGLSAEIRELAEGIAHETANNPEIRRLVRETARAIIAALQQAPRNGHRARRASARRR
jgi:hypothetical protein